MLKHLTISHYALIERLDTDWHPGFSVITGETGAGKSIMLGALNLLLGGRADSKAIQTGEKKCMVEATFSMGAGCLKDFFEANDIDYDPDECILRREVLASGKSRAFINDTPVHAARLKEIGASLIDIHSQHQNLLIRNEHFLIETLDTMATQPLLLSTYQEAYRQCREVTTQLKQLTEKAAKGQDEQDYLRYQLEQIDNAGLSPTEQDELEKEQQVLAHAEDIKQAIFQARQLIETDELSVPQNLRQAAESLRSIADNYPEASQLADRLDSSRIELDDIANELESHTDGIDYDPSRLSFIEERLSTIYELEQKHHVQTTAELIELADKLRAELNGIDNLGDDIKRLTAEAERLTQQRNEAAAALTEARRAAGVTMCAELAEALRHMGMPHAQLAVQIDARPEPDAWGADNVTFLFSANKNVPPQDASQIASGGEIARLMLALKALIARRTLLPTIIFDEIDTGVSGNMAESMAEVMKQIARTCQVICITHLPQIAALGAHHYKVYKDDSAEQTRSHIIPLTDEQRVEEIAHMLSGARLTEAAIDNARALLRLQS